MESGKKKQHCRKKQDDNLLVSIKEAHEVDLHKEIEDLKTENEHLQGQVRRYQRLDGYLKRAEKLVKELEQKFPSATTRHGRSWAIRRRINRCFNTTT
ncbi:hypothetical protein V5799_033531 [Amblyomma americanum]|uniref:Uncharacterized protein n=1 Tax=Amblyomma americanum TaxID=6943 RepID=A0AAQ4DN20_AMBAM